MTTTDPIERFVRFHRRVRASLDRLDAVVDARSWTTSDRRSAARLADFFHGPLVHHDHDEEVSLLPRLRRRIGDADSLVVCSRWHEAMEHLVDEIVPVLRGVAEGTTTTAPALLVVRGHGLRKLLERHLVLEEEEIFPLARRLLSDDDLRDVAAEITRRAVERKLGTRRVLVLGAAR